MPQKAVSMRKIKEVLRLRFAADLNQEQIARSCSIGQSTVHRYLKVAATAGLKWPLPEEYDDRQLNELLFPSRPDRSPPARWSRFRRSSSRTENASAPDAAVDLGRISPHSTRWLRVQPFLRVVSTVESESQRRDAAGPPSWRKDVCGLGRSDSAHLRSANRRSDAGFAVCRRPRGHRKQRRR